MTLDLERLNTASSSLYREEGGHYYQGNFVYLLQDTRSAKFYPHLKGDSDTARNLATLENNYLAVHMDLLNLATVCLRLKWQQGLWSGGELDDDFWRYFASLDIDIYFSKYRSIFDYIAQIVNLISKKPNQSPTSFNDLKKWVLKSNNQFIIGDELTQYILSCHWFSDLKTLRDSIEHEGAETVPSYNDKTKILFQIYDKGMMQIQSPKMIIYNNLVDFEIYAGLYTGYLIDYLEELSQLIYNQLTLHDIDRDAKDYHPGYGIIKDWISRVIK